MKKKLNIREQREAKKAAAKQKYAAKAAAEQKKADETVVAAQPAGNTANSKPIKSRNKAAGLKSTFVVGESLYMTSFGKGNLSVPEYLVDTGDAYRVDPISEHSELHVLGADDLAVSFSGTRRMKDVSELKADNPLHSGKNNLVPKNGSDILGLKGILEQRYYGRNFDDNVHIQIIYNILDIEKNLAIYVTNVVAALDHMCDETLDTEHEDFIGYMNTMNSFDVFMHPSQSSRADIYKKINDSRRRFENLLRTKRLGYFGFAYNPKDRNQKKRLYYLMSMIGQLRQFAFHKDSPFNRVWLYQLDEKLSKEHKDTLNYFFDQRYDEIHENFNKTNKVNLELLAEAFPSEDYATLANQYYDFTVFKAHKNLGFSIKKLREKLIENALRDEKIDSFRSKLYRLIDFCLFRIYLKDPDRAEKNVRFLRSCINEQEKEQFYTQEANALKSENPGLVNDFCMQLKDRYSSGSNSTENAEKKEDFPVFPHCHDKQKVSNVSLFAKLMYAFCLFLDGKEINELLSALLNKFDTIACMTKCTKDLGIYAPFSKDFNFFEDSEQRAEEMNLVKSIARMTKPDIQAKEQLFRDALDILGVEVGVSEEALKKEIHQYFQKGAKHDFRNFIINNVINSTRFIYVIKFCNPKTAGQIIRNENILRFVLQRMPKEQIERYYHACTETLSRCTHDEMIQCLSNIITTVRYEKFCNVAQKSRDTTKQKEKERFKAIIRLYLTAIYLVVKNLVYVNARYVLAFHCLERDADLFRLQIKQPLPDGKKKSDYLKLAADQCGDNPENKPKGYLARNKRLCQCVREDIDNAKHLAGDITDYRNCVAHLNVVRNCDQYLENIDTVHSYFSLYQYLVQHYLLKKFEKKKHRCKDDLAIHYYSQVKQYRGYVKDLVKALNAPFGYNIPRFKNLTIEQLFDRNADPETITA